MFCLESESPTLKEITSSILSLHVPRWVVDDTDLPSNSNISKTIKVNIAFTSTFLKKYLIIW